MLLSLASLAYSQPTSSNFKVEHTSPSSLDIKVHVVNTQDFNMYQNILNNNILVHNGYLFHCTLGIENNKIFNNPLNPDKSNIGDTAMTLLFTLINNPLSTSNSISIDFYFNNNVHYINTPLLYFTDFVVSDHYTPCYATVGPDVNKPSVFWESLSGNAISHYIIKRNGTSIATVPYSIGILSYTDLANTQASNFVQEYSVVAVDSSGNERSGIVTTLHARNLSSVDGNVEMDWTTPIAAGTISNFVIYEYRQLTPTSDTLIEIVTLPSNITQYTVQSPNPTSSYVVGVKNVNCLGTAKRGSQNILLSNKLKGSSLAGIESLYVDNRNDEVIGHFDLMGRAIDPETKGQLIIVQYKSGRVDKVINN